MSLSPDDTVSAKRLVAYNTHEDGIRNLSVAIASGSHFNRWDILQVQEPIPSSHTYIKDHAAYFSSPTVVGNLFHFWRDFYTGLYGLMNKTSQLGVPDGSYLYFLQYNDGMCPWSTFNASYKKDRYKDFLYALGIRPGYRMFFNETVNKCFKNAVFGYAPTSSAKVVSYLATKLPFDSNKCNP